MRQGKKRAACHSFLRGTASALVLATLAGCSMQAKIIQSRHWDLNETIRQTKEQQLLLNMVRMRYEETPYFLQLSSITTSFSAGANAGLQATLPSGGDAPDVYTPSAGFSYSETPTVTWSIPDSSEMLARFYAPIGTNQLTVLTQSGFDFIDVFSIGSRKINALPNRTFSMKDGVLVPPDYDAFREALRLIKELTREGLADTTYSLNAKYGGVTLPISQMEPRGVAEGLASRGLQPGDRVEIDARMADKKELPSYMTVAIFDADGRNGLRVCPDEGDVERPLRARPLLGAQLNRSGQITPIYRKWFGQFSEKVPTLVQALFMLNSTPE